MFSRYPCPPLRGLYQTPLSILLREGGRRHHCRPVVVWPLSLLTLLSSVLTPPGWHEVMGERTCPHTPPLPHCKQSRLSPASKRRQWQTGTGAWLME